MRTKYNESGDFFLFLALTSGNWKPPEFAFFQFENVNFSF
jgi:hypothetical protein